MVLYTLPFTSCRTHNSRERRCNNNRGQHSNLVTVLLLSSFFMSASETCQSLMLTSFNYKIYAHVSELLLQFKVYAMRMVHGACSLVLWTASYVRTLTQVTINNKNKLQAKKQTWVQFVFASDNSKQDVTTTYCGVPALILHLSILL